MSTQQQVSMLAVATGQQRERCADGARGEAPADVVQPIGNSEVLGAVRGAFSAAPAAFFIDDGRHG